MAHVSRLRKNFKFAPVELINDSNVLACGEKLNGLLARYGKFVFGVSTVIFWENLPGRVMEIIENQDNG